MIVLLGAAGIAILTGVLAIVVPIIIRKVGEYVEEKAK
jgi:hypothetical protein